MYHVKKIPQTRSIWLSIGQVKKVSRRDFWKRRKQGLPIFHNVHHLNFLTDSVLIHASDVSRMRNCVSILKILELKPAKFSLK